MRGSKRSQSPTTTTGGHAGFANLSQPVPKTPSAPVDDAANHDTRTISNSPETRAPFRNQTPPGRTTRVAGYSADFYN